MTDDAKKADGSPRTDCLSWDWNEQPPFDALASSINFLLQDGATQIQFYLADSGTADPCLVIADRELTQEQVDKIWEDDSDHPDDDPASNNQLTKP